MSASMKWRPVGGDRSVEGSGIHRKAFSAITGGQSEGEATIGQRDRTVIAALFEATDEGVYAYLLDLLDKHDSIVIWLEY